MNSIIVGIIIIVVLVIIMGCGLCGHLVKEHFNDKSLEVYKHFGGRTAPSVMIIASMHGDEPAPHYAAKEIIKLLSEGKWRYPGEIWIIPAPNNFGLRHNIRENRFFRDLNRQFKENSPDVDAKQIMKMIHTITYVVDLHEGYEFNKEQPWSYGSTVYYGLDGDRYIAENMVRKINEHITDENKKFGVFQENVKTIEKGSLNHWRLVNGQSSFLVETTGKKNKQPLDIRVRQHIDAVQGLLEAIGR